jgi:hypothetical protein
VNTSAGLGERVVDDLVEHMAISVLVEDVLRCDYRAWSRGKWHLSHVMGQPHHPAVLRHFSDAEHVSGDQGR